MKTEWHWSIMINHYGKKTMEYQCYGCHMLCRKTIKMSKPEPKNCIGERKMKRDEVITKEDLVKQGWSRPASMDRFGGCEIWMNGDNRILWHYDRKKVMFIFKAKN